MLDLLTTLLTAKGARTLTQGGIALTCTAAAVVVVATVQIAIASLRAHSNRRFTSATSGALPAVLDAIPSQSTDRRQHSGGWGVSNIVAVQRNVRAAIASALALGVAPTITIGSLVATHRGIGTAVGYCDHRRGVTVSTGTKAHVVTSSTARWSIVKGIQNQRWVDQTVVHVAAQELACTSSPIISSLSHAGALLLDVVSRVQLAIITRRT